MTLTVNGVLIPEEKIIAEMDRLRERYQEYVRENGGEPSENELREWAEEDLIEAELFRAEALATQPEPDAATVQRNIEASPDFYAAIPEGERLTRSREALCVRAMEKEIRKRVPRPTETELRAWYAEHPEQFATEEELLLSHICRWIGLNGASRTDAYLELLHVRSELAKGALQWNEAVVALSDTCREDYGMFPAVRRNMLPKAVEDKLFALAEGEVSDAVELDGESVHLFRLLEKQPPHDLAFKDVRETLSTALFERAYQEALDAVFDALKASATIQREP